MENIYAICTKPDWNSKYKTWGSGGENTSTDGTKVQFSNRFTGEQIKTLVTDTKVTIYNREEISTVLDSVEWKEEAPITVVVDKKFKNDYNAASNKLTFLKGKLGL